MNERLTPSRLWKRMNSDQRTRAARAFWGDEEAAGDHVQAIVHIAQQKKFRPKTVALLDIDRKSRHLGSLKILPDSLAARVLIVYHLSEQRPMMGTFLDALGIPHKDGLIHDDGVVPDSEKLTQAVKAVTDKFPSTDVSLYLNTLLCQDPETWGALSELSELAEPVA